MTSGRPHPVVAALGVHDHVEALLDAACVEAEQRGSDLVLVHVVPAPAPTAPEERALADSSPRAVGLSRLHRAEHQLGGRLQDQRVVSTELLEGSVVEQVVARSADASVVVLQRGPEQRGRLAVLAHLGGVAARSHAPVLSVPSTWRRKEWDARPVCVGVEPAPAPAVLRAALEQARRTTGTLRLVCADDAGAVAEAALRERVAPILEDYPDVVTQVVAWRGRPAGALLAESRECSALVLGRHHHLLPFGSHLGPVVSALLREAGCPVLVVDPTGSDRAVSRGTLVPDHVTEAP